MKYKHKNNRLKTISINMKLNHLKKEHMILKIPYSFSFWYKLLKEVKEIQNMTGIPEELKGNVDEIRNVAIRKRLSF